MGARWQSAMRVVVVAAVGTAGVMQLTSASNGATRVVEAPATARPVPTSPQVATLPPVTEHAIDPAVLAAAAASAAHGGQSMVQTIQLTVVGGELELLTHEATIELEGVPGSTRAWTALLPPVRVVDARGSHQGWNVQWHVDSVELASDDARGAGDGRVTIEPGSPVVVHGTPDGLHAGRAATATPNGRMLFSADEGSGGGTYEAGGTVSLRLPPGVDADSAVVKLRFSLA